MIPILGLLAPIIEKALSFIPDPAKKAQAQLELEREINAHSEKILASLTAIDTAQAATNTEEAKSLNVFIAGWRPFIGWVCGASFAWVFVLQPILTFILAAAGKQIALPTLDFSQMSTVLLGMLGLGGMRTFEKYQEVQDKH